MSRRAPVLLLGLNALALAGLAAWAAAGWPGAPNPIVAAGGYYCEALRPGWVRQPANTWSCLAFVAVGALLAARARTRRQAALAVLISLIGPGSMALHASMTLEGGVLDVASMFWFIGFAAAHNASRLLPALDARFGAACGLGAVALLALAAAASRLGTPVFASLVGAFAVTEAALARLRPGGDRRFLAAAAGLFAAAFVFWLPSVRPDGPLCVDPGSLLQGHAAWHALTALAAGAVYLHLEPGL